MWQLLVAEFSSPMFAFQQMTTSPLTVLAFSLARSNGSWRKDVTHFAQRQGCGGQRCKYIDVIALAWVPYWETIGRVNYIYCMAELVHWWKGTLWLVPWAVRILLYAPLRWTTHELIPLICVVKRYSKWNFWGLSKNVFLVFRPKSFGNLLRKGRKK